MLNKEIETFVIVAMKKVTFLVIALIVAVMITANRLVTSVTRLATLHETVPRKIPRYAIPAIKQAILLVIVTRSRPTAMEICRQRMTPFVVHHCRLVG